MVPDEYKGPVAIVLGTIFMWWHGRDMPRPKRYSMLAVGAGMAAVATPPSLSGYIGEGAAQALVTVSAVAILDFVVSVVQDRKKLWALITRGRGDG